MIMWWISLFFSRRRLVKIPENITCRICFGTRRFAFGLKRNRATRHNVFEWNDRRRSLDRVTEKFARSTTINTGRWHRAVVRFILTKSENNLTQPGQELYTWIAYFVPPRLENVSRVLCYLVKNQYTFYIREWPSKRHCRNGFRSDFIYYERVLRAINFFPTIRFMSDERRRRGVDSPTSLTRSSQQYFPEILSWKRRCLRKKKKIITILLRNVSASTRLSRCVTKRTRSYNAL